MSMLQNGPDNVSVPTANRLSGDSEPIMPERTGTFAGKPITHRSPRWQERQAEVVAISLNHIRRRRRTRTVVSALSWLFVVVHTYLLHIGDWVVLTTSHGMRHFYE